MPAIETVGLRKQYGSFTAVQGVSLRVEEGENFGLLGPNGAGKSTFIRMLTTLLIPTAGTAMVANHDIRSDADAVRRKIGVVPQPITSDLKLTAAENLDFYAKLHSVPGAKRRRIVTELLEWIGLVEWRDKMVGTFSIGMRRRLEIARCLVHQPSIIFLDEPTTGLDPAARISMWEMISRVKAERTVTLFLTTHYMEEADELCDRIAIFDHGTVVAQGTPEELKATLPSAEVIELRVDAAPGNWVESLRGLPGVEDLADESGLVRIYSRERSRTLSAILDLARELGVDISSLSLRENTLEDVFLHHTGRATRDETGGFKVDQRVLQS
jgi:ABC-2 type transport system ATP-binding protein